MILRCELCGRKEPMHLGNCPNHPKNLKLMGKLVEAPVEEPVVEEPVVEEPKEEEPKEEEPKEEKPKKKPKAKKSKK